MLTETTVNKLNEMKLTTMARAFKEQLTTPNIRYQSEYRKNNSLHLLAVYWKVYRFCKASCISVNPHHIFFAPDKKKHPENGLSSAFFEMFFMAGAEGLEPSARGFGVALGVC